jgi:hypothetical protein
MKKKSKDEIIDELRPKYDLGEMLEAGVLGNYADRVREGANPDLSDQDSSRGIFDG